MGEEQARADLPGQAAQVGVVSGRRDLALEPGFRGLAVPAEAEAVAIGQGLGLDGAQAQVD